MMLIFIEIFSHFFWRWGNVLASQGYNSSFSLDFWKKGYAALIVFSSRLSSYEYTRKTSKKVLDFIFFSL
jgi:hypothetical protein